MLMLDEKVLAEFLAADLERNRKLDALISALQQTIKEEETPEWIGLKETRDFSGFDSQRLSYLSRKGELRKKKISDKTFLYNYEDLRRICCK